MSMKREKGFTLLELMIAIMIFAIMSAMAYGGLNSALNTRDHADAQAERLAQLQKTMMIMERDIEQAIDRPVRNNYGDTQPALSGSGYGSSLLEFSRSGRPNPMQLQRSNLERVGYLLQEDKLLRQLWPVLDRSLDSEPYEALLLDKVKGIDLRFLDENKQWQTQWPSATPPDPNQPPPPAMPRAVEITLDLEDWGRIRRVFEVPYG
jgi:general secretion pathway protein J